MTDLILRDISEPTLSELERRGQANGRSPEDEALAIVEELVLRERYARIAKEQGLGSALNAIGRDFDITDEFDNLREKQGQ